MINYIKGEITFKNPTFIIVEASGIGYKVNISLSTYTIIEKLNEVKILIWEVIKEDSRTLYGFANEEERKMFIHLISVSGIGATTAQIILSSLSTAEVKSAIVGEQDKVFSQVKGIGPKTAKRLILDLKDKMLKEGVVETTTVAQDNTIRDEALSGLVALGYNKIHAQRALNKVLKEKGKVDTVQELIKLGLNQLLSGK